MSEFDSKANLIPEAWLDFVRENREKLSKAIYDAGGNFPKTRNTMAEYGVELTPLQLDELVMLIRRSLEIIETEDE